MIIDADLKAWLADRAAQRRSVEAAQRFAREWSRSAPHADFDRAMAAFRDPSAEEVARTACTLLGDDDWVDSLIGRLAKEMRADRCFEPPFRALNTDIHAGLLVYEDRHLTIAAGVGRLAQLARRKQAGRGMGSVNFTGQINILKFVKAGGARLAFWECDEPIGATFSATTAGRCRPAGERRIADGETVVIDGRRQAYVIAHAAASFVVLQASVKTGQAPATAEYDAASGRFIGCSAVDQSDCRIQMIATLARTLGHEEAFGAIAGFLDHPSFFVRWHAMKELLGIDLAGAWPHLKRMAARDPHPDPRAAARMVLDSIAAASLPRKAA